MKDLRSIVVAVLITAVRVAVTALMKKILGT
jgi:hypothetical protein